MSLINWEVTLDLNWSENCVVVATAKTTTFSITNINFIASVVTLSR